MIEVFKTNIAEAASAQKIIALLLLHLPGRKINIDLHDCDKVLRVEGGDFLPAAVMLLVRERGFYCGKLE
jgi:hypothetical protein